MSLNSYWGTQRRWSIVLLVQHLHSQPSQCEWRRQCRRRSWRRWWWRRTPWRYVERPQGLEHELSPGALEVPGRGGGRGDGEQLSPVPVPEELVEKNRFHISNVSSVVGAVRATSSVGEFSASFSRSLPPQPQPDYCFLSPHCCSLFHHRYLLF